MTLDMRFAVPSRGRPEKMEHILSALPEPLIFVADDEAETYLAAGVPESQLRTHPNLYGLARIRNWINDHMDSEIVVQVDDDFKKIQCWAGEFNRHVYYPSGVFAIAAQAAQTAKDLGTPLFCWSNLGRPTFYKPDDPFSFTGPAGRALGVVGRELRWDDSLTSMVDTDASLQVLMKWRFLVCDRRYYWNCGFIYGNKGGCQDIRTASVRARDRSIMRQKWGDAFDIDRKSRTGTSVNAITVDRRLKI